MDINILISIVLGPLIAFVLSTIKNPSSIVKLKKSLPLINRVIDVLMQLRDAIEMKSGALVKLKAAAAKANAAHKKAA